MHCGQHSCHMYYSIILSFTRKMHVVRNNPTRSSKINSYEENIINENKQQNVPNILIKNVQKLMHSNLQILKNFEAYTSQLKVIS